MSFSKALHAGLRLARAMGAVGMVASCVFNLATLIGVELGQGSLFWTLHAGVLTIIPPLVYVNLAFFGFPSFRSLGECIRYVQQQGRFEQAVVRECPAFLRRILLGLAWYSIVSFAIWLVIAVSSAKEFSPSLLTQLVSVSWIFFYSVGFMTLYAWVKSNGLRSHRGE